MSDFENLDEAPIEVLWSMLAEAEGLDRAEVLLMLGRREFDRGETAQALVLLEEAASVSGALGNSTVAFEAWRSVGFVQFMRDDFAASAQAYQKAADCAATAGRDLDQAVAMWGRADSLVNAREYGAALEAAAVSRALAESEGIRELAGDACSIMARALYYLDREPDALAACRAGRDHFRAESQAVKVARIDDFALTIHLYLGNLDDALEFALTCHVLAVNTPDTIDDAYATRRLAEVRLNRGEYQQAAELAGRARDLYRAKEIMWGVAESDAIRARALHRAGEPGQALEVFTEARVLFDAVGADDKVRECDVARAVLQHYLGHYAEAAILNQRLIDALTPTDPELYWAAARLAENHFENGHPDRAMAVVDEWLPGAMRLEGFHDGAVRYLLEAQAVALGALGDTAMAAEVAQGALGLTGEDEFSFRTALMYELRANHLLEQGETAEGRQELRNSIALHLAYGSVDRARELSTTLVSEVRERHHGGDFDKAA